MAEHHPAVEDYLKTIYELAESGIPALRARLVERLGVSAPSVSETVHRLEREGWLVLDEDRQLRLTGTGRDYAAAVMRRHRLAECLLVDVLKVPWHQVHTEAHRLEHAISLNIETHLVALLGDPAACPHGNPIPGSASAAPPGAHLPLAEVAAGAQVVLRQIDELLQNDQALMLQFETHGLLPGATLTVSAVSPRSVALSAPGGPVELLRAVAARVYVEPAAG